MMKDYMQLASVTGEDAEDKVGWKRMIHYGGPTGKNQKEEDSTSVFGCRRHNVLNAPLSYKKNKYSFLGPEHQRDLLLTAKPIND